MMLGDGYARRTSIESGMEKIADELTTAGEEFRHAFSAAANGLEWCSTELCGPIVYVVAREALTTPALCRLSIALRPY